MSDDNNVTWYAVEAIDHHPDGSATLYCRSQDGEPFVETYPPGASVTVRRRPR